MQASWCCRDARTQIDVRGEALDLAGMRYWTHKMPDIARVVRGASPTLDPARAHAEAPHRGGGAFGTAAPQRPYARWPDRPARNRRHRRPRVPAHRRRRAPRQHDRVRKSRRGNGLCAGPSQLPARSRDSSNPAGLCLNSDSAVDIPRRQRYHSSVLITQNKCFELIG